MPRVSKPAKEARYLRVQELLNEGIDSSIEIAKRLTEEGNPVSDRQVRLDILLLAKQWREDRVKLREIWQKRKVRNAERRNVQLLAEWERSKTDKQRRREKAKRHAGGALDESGQPVADETEAEQATEGRLADPAYMAEIRHNDELVIDLLGLAEPKLHQHSGPGGAAIPVTMTFEEDLSDDERCDRIRELLERFPLGGSRPAGQVDPPEPDKS